MLVSTPSVDVQKDYLDALRADIAKARAEHDTRQDPVETFLTLMRLHRHLDTQTDEARAKIGYQLRRIARRTHEEDKKRDDVFSELAQARFALLKNPETVKAIAASPMITGTAAQPDYKMWISSLREQREGIRMHEDNMARAAAWKPPPPPPVRAPRLIAPPSEGTRRSVQWAVNRDVVAKTEDLRARLSRAAARAVKRLPAPPPMGAPKQVK